MKNLRIRFRFRPPGRERNRSANFRTRKRAERTLSPLSIASRFRVGDPPSLRRIALLSIISLANAYHCTLYFQDCCCGDEFSSITRTDAE